MSKPAVSRALDTLGKLDFLRRKTDEADRRSVLVQRTVKGSVYLRDFGDLAAEAAKGIDRDSAAGP
jgi:DNA-binding MarR family transcriptional regulator